MADTTETRPTIFDKLEERGKAEGRTEGRTEGEVDMLLLILEQRGIELDEADRERITSCTDTGQLRYWATRAFQVDTADRLFG
ncbi:RpnC/YadD family protein [Glycomyces xiaoerkulensis]|uniref:hypothetical protein n=1 Tax=Glycomyces xiaoerkulensis TaxID=2038139 RepID=UPI000C261E94|nr:hypothetical protein [Glycomyces xiaoerkulensis]